MAEPGLFHLTDDEADAIGELFNIGMGEATASVGAVLGEEVVLSVPAFAVSSRRRIASELEPEVASGDAARICAVRGAFSGPFTGEAMLLFPERGTMALASRLVPVDPAADAPGEMEQDVLTEIGNILMNGCLASLSNLVEGEIAGTLAVYDSGPARSFIGTDDTPVLFVRIDIALAAGDARGHALFLLDITSLDAFRQAIRRSLSNL
ncbi:chemotaxis protein [Azospirillum thermophilum]|uniref:Chemotaxis protein n=1 Tax=Azospirillum thermophilum TaxID=2202148 RepID=A0A2S2CSD3_9PROT|nr:chemotaxis protein [Azospirillum thermophilum]AWK87421.1 chemotaxis protein [Azospirillum thermophilum]